MYNENKSPKTGYTFKSVFNDGTVVTIKAPSELTLDEQCVHFTQFLHASGYGFAGEVTIIEEESGPENKYTGSDFNIDDLNRDEDHTPSYNEDDRFENVRSEVKRKKSKKGK